MKPLICVLSEYNKNSQSPTGMLYEIRGDADLIQFNNNFNYDNNFVVIQDDSINRFFNADSVTDYIKSISNI